MSDADGPMSDDANGRIIPDLKTVAGRKTDWFNPVWFDGRARELTKGVHYTIDERVMRNRLTAMAHKFGCKVITIIGDDKICIQLVAGENMNEAQWAIVRSKYAFKDNPRDKETGK